MVGRAAELVRAGTRPVLVSGNGVRLAKAKAELRLFAERFDIPVVTTAAGKGTVDVTHPFAADVIGGYGAHDAANAVLGAADVVIAVGTKLPPTDTANETPELIDPSPDHHPHRRRAAQYELDRARGCAARLGRSPDPRGAHESARAVRGRGTKPDR